MGTLRRLRIDWFDRWHPDLDAALATLPEMPMCPHELYRDLVTNRGPVEKRAALVTSGGDPVAVVGVRRDGQRWTPVTTWIVPGSLFPVRDGMLVPVLTAFDVPLFVVWWRQSEAPPESDRFTRLEGVETRRLSVQGNYEAFWKETRLWRRIADARRKCQSLTVAVNVPGAAEWTLMNWGRKWAPEGFDEVPDMRDRLVVARYWEPRGRHFALSLLDGDKPAGAAVMFVHGDHVIGLAYHREPAYEKYSIGTRLIDAVHQWAASEGYEAVDVGGGDRYKEQWAPVGGMRWQFVVAPKRSLVSRARSAAWRRLRKAVGHVLPAKTAG
ncbi:MAG TPA: GNAT family N-acetyltransferase [Gammaproteobacteria bacterium]